MDVGVLYLNYARHMLFKDVHSFCQRLSFSINIISIRGEKTPCAIGYIFWRVVFRDHNLTDYVEGIVCGEISRKPGGRG